MRAWLTIGLVATFGATANAAERRELGAHEHGHSKLNLAVEGTRVAMEIAAPGLDVLGFEHPAATGEEKAAVETGKATLGEPLGLFVLPAAAGCRVVEAAVELLQEEHEGEEHGEAENGDDAALHNEFQGSYTLDCADPGALTEHHLRLVRPVPQCQGGRGDAGVRQGADQLRGRARGSTVGNRRHVLKAALATREAASAVDAAAPALALADVRFAWPGRKAFALEVESFALTRGERVLLLGPSGSGKSTLLNLVCGVLAPTAGRIEVLGIDLGALTGAARDRFRAAHFGILFQMFNLLPYLSAVDNVLLPLGFAPERRRRGGVMARRCACWRGWAWPTSRTSRPRA